MHACVYEFEYILTRCVVYQFETINLCVVCGVCGLMHVHTYVCMSVAVLRLALCVRTYIHTYIHTYTHTYIHTYIRTYVCEHPVWSVAAGGRGVTTRVQCHSSAARTGDNKGQAAQEREGKTCHFSGKGHDYVVLCFYLLRLCQSVHTYVYPHSHSTL